MLVWHNLHRLRMRNRVAELLAKGMKPEDAEKRALKDVGNPWKLPGNAQHEWNGEHAECSCGQCAICDAIAKRARRAAKRAA